MVEGERRLPGNARAGHVEERWDGKRREGAEGKIGNHRWGIYIVMGRAHAPVTTGWAVWGHAYLPRRGISVV